MRPRSRTLRRGSETLDGRRSPACFPRWGQTSTNSATSSRRSNVETEADTLQHWTRSSSSAASAAVGQATPCAAGDVIGETDLLPKGCRIGRDIHGMLLERGERNDLKRSLVGGRQHYECG